jgi:DNA repair protein RadC
MAKVKIANTHVSGSRSSSLKVDEDRTISTALNILQARATATASSTANPGSAFNLARLLIGGLRQKACAVLFLGQECDLIKAQVFFTGEMPSPATYRREVASKALELNAKGVVLVHNIPKGHLLPSEAALQLTVSLACSLELVGVLVLDHVLVNHSGHVSLREMGWVSAKPNSRSADTVPPWLTR